MKKWACIYLLILIGAMSISTVQASPVVQKHEPGAHLIEEFSDACNSWEQPQHSNHGGAIRSHLTNIHWSFDNKNFLSNNNNCWALIVPSRIISSRYKAIMRDLPLHAHFQIIFPFHYYW